MHPACQVKVITGNSGLRCAVDIRLPVCQVYVVSGSSGLCPFTCMPGELLQAIQVCVVPLVPMHLPACQVKIITHNLGLCCPINAHLPAHQVDVITGN